MGIECVNHNNYNRRDRHSLEKLLQLYSMYDTLACCHKHSFLVFAYELSSASHSTIHAH